MLSICIPVYNSDATELVSSLLNQIKKLDFKVEICLIDDASPIPKLNASSFNDPLVIFYRNNENVGRSKVRNQFLVLAKYPYLLFIDGDSRIINPNFLITYLQKLEKSNVEVLCGASIYQSIKPDRAHYLRWKYSIVRESKSLIERQDNAKLGFKTNNFIIHRSIFNRIKFDETLIGYGHEDSLFGFELRKAHIRIEHVDNPVLNYLLDDNDSFLQKTKVGVQNLKRLLFIVNFDPDFIESSKLSRAYIWIKKYQLSLLIYPLMLVIHPINKYLLSKGYFILPMFDLYKLSLMIQKK
jgi:glycosyltransferase involved in cell wall biosynthesis